MAFFFSHLQVDSRYRLTDFNAGFVSIFIIISWLLVVLEFGLKA